MFSYLSSLLGKRKRGNLYEVTGAEVSPEGTSGDESAPEDVNQAFKKFRRKTVTAKKKKQKTPKSGDIKLFNAREPRPVRIVRTRDQQHDNIYKYPFDFLPVPLDKEGEITLHPENETEFQNILANPQNEMSKIYLGPTDVDQGNSRTLGSGTFNDVFEFHYKDEDDETEVEDKCIRLSNHAAFKLYGGIESEFQGNKLHSEISEKCGEKFVAKTYGYGKYSSGGLYIGTYLIMEKLGPDLIDFQSEHRENGTVQKDNFGIVRHVVNSDWLARNMNVIFKQIVEGVQCLHKKAERAHFDIKSENIVLKTGNLPDLEAMLANEIPIVKIIDFGYSQAIYNDDGTATMQFDNTRSSISIQSPEIKSAARGRGYDFRADLWALGLLYENLLVKTANKVWDEDEWYAKMKRPDIKERYNSAADILTAIPDKSLGGGKMKKKKKAKRGKAKRGKTKRAGTKRAGTKRKKKRGKAKRKKRKTRKTPAN
tara:strand:- start:2592 stop:4037 length:1446 start_codon:yes stop_codon:yes gene_type:complete